MNIKELLSLTVESKASDLHISAGMPPMIRVDGEMQSLDYPIMKNNEVKKLIFEVMNEKQKKIYEEKLEIDFSMEISDLYRFRVNAFHQNRGAAAAFRPIPPKVFTLEDLNAPSIFQKISNYSNGLILVTGPTGSGKSTTLAAMIDFISKNKKKHIITIEDPIEFVYDSKNSKSLINQREVLRDTYSFQNALRSSLREDPDVILVGEMRDLETIQLALTAAETGHLVFATLHTSSAIKTVDRIIDVFHAQDKNMVRSMLSGSLKAVISQVLLKRIGKGRVVAYEIMLATHAIRNLIRESKIAQMYSVIQTGRMHGMQTLDQNLKELINDNVIVKEEAIKVARNKEHFK